MYASARRHGAAICLYMCTYTARLRVCARTYVCRNVVPRKEILDRQLARHISRGISLARPSVGIIGPIICRDHRERCYSKAIKCVTV